MRLILLTHRFLPRYFGGVETYTLRLAQALQAQGHSVSILTGEPVSRPDRSISRTQDEVEGVPVTRLVYDFLRFPVTSRAAYADPAFTAAIRAVLADLQPNLVHATSLSLLMGGAIEAAYSLNLPLVYTATDYVLTCRRGTYVKADNTICAIKEEPVACAACMGPHTALERGLTRLWRWLPSPFQSPLLQLAENLTGKHADFLHADASIAHRFAYLSPWRSQIAYVIAPSSYMRDMFLLNSFPPDKLTVLHHGLPPPPVVPAKNRSDQLRLAYIGRIIPIKGVHLLLDALIRLPPAVQARLQLTLYGEADNPGDDYLQAVKQQAATLPQVNFVGRVDQVDLPQIYRQTDLLVVPSVWPENCPVTVLEAQAYHTPVIGSQIGGIPDLIRHNHNGLIFEPGRVAQLSRLLAQCVHQPDLVKRLTANSQLIKTMTEDAQAILAVYRQLSTAIDMSDPAP